jgi:ATP-dependent helicase HepA
MFEVGQRWISDTESDLGLGMVQEVDFRQVAILFPVAEEVRRYSKEQAPLTRIKFNVEDTVLLEDGSKLTITEVQELNGILFYGDADRIIPETQLSGHIQLSQASERLLAGQVDNSKAYELRLRALQMKSKLQERKYYGLVGSRTTLLPHQLFIANEVSSREAPRVLLADEVGLGKTIEAGMIMHRLLLNERIERVLVLLPEALTHQWLVEMVRRFNLRFSVLDEGRCLALEDQEDGGNPYLQQQLVLAPLNAIANDPKRREQVLSAGWDMVVVDEAHHLGWSPTSHDESYGLVESLAHETPGLLLLTATPEQLGMEGHFARLRLLDPERFHNLEEFIQEQSQFQPVVKAAQSLLSGEVLEQAEREALQALLNQEIPPQPDPEQAQVWIKQLIDQHGTGRVLFRNTRSSMTGFPNREVIAQPFTIPREYESLRGFEGMYPEREIIDWERVDPRIDWINELIKANKGEKFLLITHQQKTVLQIERALWERHGTQCAVFHEDMDMIERDRAAAYFAEQEGGAQILLCSEIGSEGRNFQFARHLILFDLPDNCDLIEQRIGRLDRIGQKFDIQLHIPFFEDHVSERLFELLNVGVDVFSHPNPLAQSLLNSHRTDMIAAIESPEISDLYTLVDTLIPEREAQQEALENGRDRLLELQSCDPEKSKALLDEILSDDMLDQAVLPSFLEQVCDVYGILQQDHSHHCYILRPGDHMLTSYFPHLPEDGLTYTCRRDVAVARDDVQFFTWEHPLVVGALDLILSEEHGNSNVAYVENHNFSTGDFYFQAQYTLDCQAPKSLQIQRYLPAEGLHIAVDPEGNIEFQEPDYLDFPEDLKRSTASGLVKRVETGIKKSLKIAKKAAEAQLPKQLALGEKRMTIELDAEISRLRELQKTNRNIRDSEIEMLEQKKEALQQAISQANYKMDNIRIVFCG